MRTHMPLTYVHIHLYVESYSEELSSVMFVDTGNYMIDSKVLRISMFPVHGQRPVTQNTIQKHKHLFLLSFRYVQALGETREGILALRSNPITNLNTETHFRTYIQRTIDWHPVTHSNWRVKLISIAI